MSSNRFASRLIAALGATAMTAAAPLVAQLDEDPRLSYSYVRTIEGRASLSSYGSGPGDEAELHQVLQRGDRLRVERGARLEVVLADRNLLRIGGGSDLTLASVAFSADGDDRTTRISLDRGELVLEVTEEALGDQLPEVQTLTARIFVNEPGSYRIRAESHGYTEVVVRAGYAEMLTDRGSTVVRTGEEAWTSGDPWRPVEVANAGPSDALERWGRELDERARAASDRVLYVEPELRYAAAPLADYGSWITVDNGWYWRPRVAVDWRPYDLGRWSWTPSGLTWVSNEPWGWVPYHYGTWCLLPGHGWAWRPGRVYSPAWVYWYWSDSWTGWCPIGYYTDFYRPYWNTSFRIGVYGWTGGHWGFYSNWSFSPTRRVCDRRPGSGWHHGDGFSRQGFPEAPNGVLTTDTGGLPRDRWDRPAELVRVLERKGRDGRGEGLPDVTDFVARKPELPREVDRAVRHDAGERGRERFGSPLDPGTTIAGRGSGERARPELPSPGWRSARPDGRVAGGASGPAIDPVDPVDRMELSRGWRNRVPPPPIDVSSNESSKSSGSAASDAVGERAGDARGAAGDRQLWRENVGRSGYIVAPRTAGGSGTPAPRADSRAAGDGSTRGWRDGRPNDPSRATERYVPPVDGAATSGESRRNYGYPAREFGGPPAWTPPGGASGGSDGTTGSAAPPVERVIGGVRRTSPPSGSTGVSGSPGSPGSSGSSGFGWPSWRTTSPPAGPSVRPPSGSGGSSTPRGSVSAPRGTPPGNSGGYSSPRSAPDSRGAGARTSSSSGGRGSSNSPKASQAPKSSNSSGSSSPPPRRRQQASDDD